MGRIFLPDTNPDTYTVSDPPTNTERSIKPPGAGTVLKQQQHDARNNPFYGLANGPQLARGQMYQAVAGTLPGSKSKKKGRIGFDFLYNPTQVEHDNTVQFSVLPPAQQGAGSGGGGTGNAAAALTPGSAQVSWDLILDRTYEVWKNPRHPGVLADVRQLEAMVGYTPESPFMEATAVYVVFGDPAQAFSGRQNVLWYYGWLQNYSVIYTNWTQYMVPYRAALSGVSLQIVSSSLSAKKFRKLLNNQKTSYSGVDTSAGVVTGE